MLILTNDESNVLVQGMTMVLGKVFRKRIKFILFYIFFFYLQEHRAFGGVASPQKGEQETNEQQKSNEKLATKNGDFDNLFRLFCDFCIWNHQRLIVLLVNAEVKAERRENPVTSQLLSSGLANQTGPFIL